MHRATTTAGLDWPLMQNNLSRDDLDAVCQFLKQDDPVLTQGANVRAFEEEWSAWLGVRHSVLVNSGSSANLLTIAALKELYGSGGEIIVPPLTWVSDIAAVLHCGFEPVFVDIDRRTLGMDNQRILEKITSRTRAVFLTHVLGYNALSQELLDALQARGIILLEDVCEAHGATFAGSKLGTFGLAANFSFYYAHHLTTIEGGMISTNDTQFYETLRMLRGHGLVRELDSPSYRRSFADDYPDLNPEFIFAFPAYNVRSTEINAILGRQQLKRLDENIRRRNENLRVFLQNLDPETYQTDFDTRGCSNYAFTLVLKNPDHALCDRVMAVLREHGVEYRRGLSGGGNQLRQPYLRRRFGNDAWREFPRTDHVHFFGFYIGNFPSLPHDKILQLCRLLNDLTKRRQKPSSRQRESDNRIQPPQQHTSRRRRHEVDLVLINPNSRRQVYQSLGNDLAAVENPVWAGLMATFCRRRGLSVAILDAEAEQWSAETVAEIVRDLNPVLAAVVVYGHQPSASTQNMTGAGRVCTAIKKLTPEQPTLLLGGHVAALPAQTLEEESADFVAAGEGLDTLVSLVEALKAKERDISKVPGLYYRMAGRIERTVDRPLLRNLDEEMPGIAWDLLPMPKYRAHNWHCLQETSRQPYAALYTTLGCPFRCSFCCIQAPFKSGERAAGLHPSANSYRFWSPRRILDEIDLLVQKFGVRHIKIADEMFVLNQRHVQAICDGLIERDYGLNLWAYTRVDTIKNGLLEKLKAAGFNWLAVGIEAGAARVRDNVDKSFDQEEVFRTIADIRAAGINIIGNYIFGLPEDDADTMQATLDLAIELNCEFANFYSAMAYPGSPLYEMAKRAGVPLPAQWTGYSQHSRDCLPLPTRHLPAREVLRFRDQAFLAYYTNDRYLDMIARRFGPAAVAQIRSMTSHRLERDLLSGKLNVPDVLFPRQVSDPVLVGG
ncbi:MAG: hypothetical protein KatS3mg105_0164 [Gemmatales bacterium]|nr:MAG: hypothetical protein KatS3mg105_0164 [Gemmatales bacterium]